MVKYSSLLDAICVKHKKTCRLQGFAGLCIVLFTDAFKILFTGNEDFDCE